MNKRIPILLGILLVFFSAWLLVTPLKFVRLLIERLDNITYDLELRSQLLTSNNNQNKQVAIIDIDDKSLKQVGRWPWPRNTLAALIEQLNKQKVAVIALDMFLSEPENNIATTLLTQLKAEPGFKADFSSFLKKNQLTFDHDTLLAKQIAKSNVVLSMGFLPREQTQNTLPPPLLTLNDAEKNQLNLITAKGYISNLPLLQHASKQAGFINIFPDSDGIIRRAPLIIEYGDKVYPSLALQTLLAFSNEKISLITHYYGKNQQLEGIKVGDYVIPTDEKGQALIPFIGKSYTFDYYSAIDVLNGKLADKTLQGKIVFIGTSATGLGDLLPTAIQNPFPGVEIQATLVNGILDHAFSYKPAWTKGATLVITLLLGIMAAFIFPFLGPRTLGIMMIIMPIALLLINSWIWKTTYLILSFLIPAFLILILAILNIVYGYLFETRRRETLKNMFGQYVPEKHIDEMLQTKSDYGLHGEDRHMSVLFADIRDFTSIAENMKTSELVELLNTFFTPMTEIIFKYRGTIDKYIGDLIMAFWGAPLKDTRHAEHAISAALEMQKKLNALHTTLADRQWPLIKMGIGINSGIMSIGDMGSRFRRNYTVLGDAVNLASRIEGLTKFYGVGIIVTEYTKEKQSRFIFRKLDRVSVKGKKQSVDIYEVIGKETELTADLADELSRYHEGLQAYFDQQWEQAEKIMLALHNHHPDKKIYDIYIRRLETLKTHPAPPDWDGVYAHTDK